MTGLERIGLFIHALTPPVLFWGIVLGIMIFLWKEGRHRETVLFLTALALYTVAVGLTKIILAVPRPENALVTLSSYAFPSGHAASGMFLAVMGSYLYRRFHGPNAPVFAAVLFLFGTLLGISRILTHVHTPLEVLAGFAYGITIPLLCIIVFEGAQGRLK
jgi:undecaprenyl-diphosphatase